MMIGRPLRRPYVEFDVAPSELLQPSRAKWWFSRYQRQTAGPIDLTGRNPTFGQLDVLGLSGSEPPHPMLADLTPFMRNTIPGDPFAWSQQPPEAAGLRQPEHEK
jgi:hypothetical protein